MPSSHPIQIPDLILLTLVTSLKPPLTYSTQTRPSTPHLIRMTLKKTSAPAVKSVKGVTKSQHHISTTKIKSATTQHHHHHHQPSKPYHTISHHTTTKERNRINYSTLRYHIISYPTLTKQRTNDPKPSFQHPNSTAH